VNKEEIMECRELLEKDKLRIEQSLVNTERQLQDAVLEQGGDEVDEANALSNAALSIRLKERERQLLVKVNAALKRIQLGSYGECQDCGDEIGLKRLLIRPVTTLCIMCKEKQEKKEGGYNVQAQRENV
jgi:DnaK suppressor protein